MVSSHRVIEKISIHRFAEKMKYYSEKDIYCTSHTFFRLSDTQKLNINQDAIRDLLKNHEPVLVGMQANGCYAVFYKYPRQRFIRLIIDIKKDSINVITFYMITNSSRPPIPMSVFSLFNS